MTTRKQRRAESRIRRAKRNKVQKFQNFIYRVAKRKVKAGEEYYLLNSFSRLPRSLEMPLDEFMSRGQQLVGGQAVFFDRGELSTVLQDWTYDTEQSPIVLTRDYLETYYREDGSPR